MHATVVESTEALRTALLSVVARISFVAAGLDDGFGVFVRAHWSCCQFLWVLVCVPCGEMFAVLCSC